MQPLNGLFLTAVCTITNQISQWNITVSIFFNFFNFDTNLSIISSTHIFVLVQGLYYNSTADIWTNGCVEPIYDFLYSNSAFILAPIIITVSSFELIFLTKALLCGGPSDSAQYLK